MKYAQKLFVSLFIYVAIASLSAFFTPAVAKSNSIIYEYETITQKKGESLDKVLRKTQLTPKQTALVKAIPIVKEAKSARTFRFIYVVNNHRYLLREVKITRGKKTLSYVLSQQGKLRFIKGYSRILSRSLSQRKPKVSKKEKTKSKKNSKATKSSEKLTAIVLTQKKGQKLEKVLQRVKLSPLQKAIILGGRYRKEAVSTRKFKLMFAKVRGKKLLKGLSVIRGKQQIDYTVRRHGKGFRLVSLARLNRTERKQIQQQFSAARMTVIKEKSTQKSNTKANKSIAKKSKSSQSTKSPVKSKQSGNYTAVSFTQRKGQSLTSAMRSVNLTRVQRGLVNKMPATKSAKSTRRIHLLFQKQRGNKYLRAMRIVRGGRVAEYVLVKYQGRWVWANERGQVTLSGSRGRQVGRYPLRYSRVSSPFNLRRRHPITRRIRPHKGIDLAAPHGTPIYAPAGGIVEFSGRQRGYGIIVTINHQNGYKTKYAHLSRIARGVRRGARVKRGQFIARVGNTGRSTGPHLHYEILVNGRPRNPAFVRVPNSRNQGGGGVKTLKAAKANAAIYLSKLRALTR